jgi:hypothetical protein
MQVGFFHKANLLEKESEISKEIGILCHGIKLVLLHVNKGNSGSLGIFIHMVVT